MSPSLAFLPSFRREAAIVFAVVVALLAAVLSALSAQVLQGQIRRDKGAALAIVAAGVAKRLELGLRERAQQVDVLARSEELWQRGLDADQVGHALSRLRASRAWAAWLGVADAQGIVRNASDGMLVGRDVGQHPWFEGGRQGLFVGDVHPARLLAAQLAPTAGGEPPRLIDFAAPIRRDGRVIGVVGLHGDWAWAASVTASMLPPDPHLAGVQVFIVGAQGQVLQGPAGVALAGPAALRSDDGDEFLSAGAAVAEPVPGAALGWRVVVRQPVAQAFEEARHGSALVFLAGVAGALAAALLAWAAAGHLSRPLTRMAEAAAALGRGEPGAALPAVRTNRELAVLSTALQAMTERLFKANETLEQRVAERTQALQASNAELRRLGAVQHAMLDNELVGIVKLRQRQVQWHNRALGRMFDYAPGELVNQPIRLLYDDDDSWRRVGEEAYPALAAGGHYRTQIQLRRKGGDLLWIDMNGAALAEGSDESIWLMSDITALKQHQQQIEHIAFHDPLTGLANRLLLADRLRQAIALDARLGRQLAVCVLDLDGFKAVNDAQGHEAGDDLLRQVARRLQASVRANDTVARLGGDEFVLLLTPLAQAEECQRVLERVLAAVREPLPLRGGRHAQVSVSIGVAFHPDHGARPADLMRRADEAMYEAKRAGKDQVRTWRRAAGPESGPHDLDLLAPDALDP